MMQVEALLKARYQEISQRLRNPKGGIVESKVVRAYEIAADVSSKPQHRGFLPPLDIATVAQIRDDYIAGISIDRICARFQVSARTVRRLRQKHGWPLREKTKRRDEA